MKTFQDLLNLLTDEQKQLLADTINKGYWGDCEMEFVNEDGEVVTVYCDGFCTNDAKNAGHFSGRKVSAMFRSMYRKIETIHNPGSGIGEITCHCNDWWGDGSGDMMFIRDPYCDEAREWAKNYNDNKRYALAFHTNDGNVIVAGQIYNTYEEAAEAASGKEGVEIFSI